MRISTSLFQQQSIDGMLRQQAQASKTQQQIVSGERIQTPADDPVAAARLLEVREGSERTVQFQRSADRATARLSREENALAGVNNLLQGVRELAMRANNGAKNDENRAIIAQEVRQRLGELVGLANIVRMPLANISLPALRGPYSTFYSKRGGLLLSGGSGPASDLHWSLDAGGG